MSDMFIILTRKTQKTYTQKLYRLIYTVFRKVYYWNCNKCNIFACSGFQLIKVCHSSAFQTISDRSVYINIINYSGRIFLQIWIKQCKRNSMQRKNRIHIKKETRFTRDYILWWKDLYQKIFKIFSSYQFSKLELSSIYIYFYRCCFS